MLSPHGLWLSIIGLRPIEQYCLVLLPSTPIICNCQKNWSKFLWLPVVEEDSTSLVVLEYICVPKGLKFDTGLPLLLREISMEKFTELSTELVEEVTSMMATGGGRWSKTWRCATVGNKMRSVAVAADGANASAATSFFESNWGNCCWLQEQDNALMKMVRNSLQTFSSNSIEWNCVSVVGPWQVKGCVEPFENWKYCQNTLQNVSELLDKPHWIPIVCFPTYAISAEAGKLIQGAMQHQGFPQEKHSSW